MDKIIEDLENFASKNEKIGLLKERARILEQVLEYKDCIPLSVLKILLVVINNR